MSHVAATVATVTEPRIALLRAVNVGGHKKVPMAELRAALTDTGFAAVSTYIQSGNVVFTSPLDDAAAADIVRSTIASRFAVDTPVIIRSAGQLAAAIAHHPWEPGEFDEKFHHVVFLADPPPTDALDRLAERATTEDLAVVGADLHVRYRAGVAGTKLTVDQIDRRLGTVATGRNLRTVAKLRDLAAS